MMNEKNRTWDVCYEVDTQHGFCAVNVVYDVSIDIFDNEQEDIDDGDYDGEFFISEKQLAKECLYRFANTAEARRAKVIFSDRIDGIIYRHVITKIGNNYKFKCNGIEWKFKKGKPFYNPNTGNDVIQCELIRLDCVQPRKLREK